MTADALPWELTNSHQKVSNYLMTKRSNKSKPRRNKNRKQNKNKQTVNPQLNKTLKMLGSLAGNVVLPGIGGNIGANLADQGHRIFKSVTGYGDYTVSNNSMYGGDSVPKFRNATNKSIRVSNREFIRDIVSSATPGKFEIAYKADINPTQIAMFPWLSNIARCYDEWKLHGMLFEFKTTSVDALNSTNTALGKVIMATQYNPLNPDFLNAQQMENYEYSTVVKPSLSALHPLECKSSQTPVEH